MSWAVRARRAGARCIRACPITVAGRELTGTAHVCGTGAGSVPERDGARLYNTSMVFDPSGRLIAKHRKVSPAAGEGPGADG